MLWADRAHTTGRSSHQHANRLEPCPPLPSRPRGSISPPWTMNRIQVLPNRYIPSDRSAQLCRPRHRAVRHHPMGTGMSSKQKAVATRQLAAVAATAIALAVFDHDGLAGLSIDQLTTGSILERSPAGGILLAQLDEDRQPRGGGGVVARPAAAAGGQQRHRRRQRESSVPEPAGGTY